MTAPTFPITLVREATGEPFRVDDIAELNTLVAQGGWLLSEPTPGVDLAVASALPRASARAPQARESTRRAPAVEDEPDPTVQVEVKEWPPKPEAAPESEHDHEQATATSSGSPATKKASAPRSPRRRTSR